MNRTLTLLAASFFIILFTSTATAQDKNYCWSDSDYEGLYSQVQNFENVNSINELCSTLNSESAEAADMCASEGSDSCVFSTTGFERPLEAVFTSNIIYVFYEKWEENNNRVTAELKEAKTMNSNLIYCRFSGYETLNKCNSETNQELDTQKHARFIAEMDAVITSLDAGNSDDSSEEEESESSDVKTGNLYFWDTESNRALVNTKSDTVGTKYEMFDDSVKGRFISDGKGERTIRVENIENGETAENTEDGSYSRYPEGSAVWGKETGVTEINGETDFRVSVIKPETGETIQEEIFTFIPNAAQQEDENEKSEVDYNYEGKCSDPEGEIGKFPYAEDGHPRGSTELSGSCVYWAWTKHPGDNDDLTFDFVDDNTGIGSTMNMEYQFRIKSEGLNLGNNRWELRGIRKRPKKLESQLSFRAFTDYNPCSGSEDACWLNPGSPSIISGGPGNYRVKVSIYDTGKEKQLDVGRIGAKHQFGPWTFTAKE